MPSFAQTWVRDLPATEPTMIYLDTSTSTKWLYVAEHGDVPTNGQTTAPANGGRILRFDLTSGSTTPQVVATRGTGPGQFISPDGLTMNATGQLFVADRYLNKVDELSIDATTGVGTRINGFGTGVAIGGAAGATELRGPIGLARDSSGAIYVSEHGWGNPGDGGNMVSKWTFNSSTGWTRAWRVAGSGFSTPYGIAVNGSLVYVSDGFNARVQILNTADGSVASGSGWSVGSGIIPLGLSMDGSDLWAAEATGDTGGTQRIVKLNATTGALIGAAIGADGTGQLQFHLPFQAVRDTATNILYASDYHNNRVQVINLAVTAPDTTPPTVAVTGASGATSPATFAVTFSEAVTGVDAADFAATFGGSVAANGALSVTGSGTTYTVSVPFTATGTGTVNLALTASANTSIKDASNNFYAGAATSGGANTGSYSVTSTGGGGTIVLGPTVASMTLNSGATSSSGAFTVTFSEAVTGVDANDFAINANNGSTGSVASVTGSGTTYTVNFNYGGNTGAVQLAIKTSGTGITGTAPYVGVDMTATAPIPNVSGPADMTPPTAAITAGTATGTSVPFTVTFSEPVVGVTASDFTVLTSSGVTATVGTISSTGNVYTVPVNFTGTGSLRLLLPGGATTQVADATGHWMAQSAISAAVNVAGSTGGSAPVIANQTASGTQNAAFSYQVAATGATSFSIVGTPALPAGLNMSTSGLITGTPTAAGSTTVTVRATNSTGNTDAQLAITIAAAGSAPTIANQTASGTQNAAFSYQVAATGATSFSIVGTPALPAGLNMSTSGLITGTPTAAGSTTVTVRATNTNGNTDAQLTVNVAAAGSAPVIANQNASGTVNSAFSYQVAATGATSFSIVGTATLPAGLNMSTSGLITGTPSASGNTTVTVRATNTNGNTDAQLAISITPAGPTIASVTAPANGTYIAGQALNFTVNYSGAVTVTGTPQMSLTVGSTARTAAYVSGSGTNALVFRYTVAAGDNDSDGITVASPLVLNGGTMTGAGSTNASLTFTAPATTGVRVDALAPTVVSLVGSPNGSGSVTFTLTFSEAVSGVDRTDFAATGSGVTPTIGTVTPATGTSTTFTIPVTYTGTNGSINLTLNASGTAIADAAANALTTGKSAALTVGVPVISSGTISGTAGIPITPFQIVATGNPSSYSFQGSLAGLTLNTSTGVISGAPTSASSSSVTILATNTQGTGQGTITLNIAAGSGTGGGSSGGGGGGGGGGGVIVVPPVFTAPPPPPAAQSITFNSPVSAIVINTPIVLSATASSGLPVTFQVVSGSASLSGNVLTPKSTAQLIVRAAQAGNSSFAATEKDVNFGNPQKASQAISLNAIGDLPASASAVAVSATANSGLPVTLSVSGPARLSGNTIVLNGASGTVTVRAAQSGNEIYNPAADVVRTFNVRAVGQQVYLGSMGSDAFAVVIAQDNSKGVFITRLDGSGEAIVGKFKLNADGTFRVNATSSLPASEASLNPNSTPSIAALTAPRTISGSVNNGVVTGSIAELNTNFNANVSPATGTTASLAGVYVASIPGAASGDTYIVAGPNGTAYAVAVTPMGVTSGTGTISADGAINISTSGGGSIVGSVDANTGMLNGTLRTGNNTAALVGLSEAATRSDRLVNLSSRVSVTGGDASRSVIAGFVISGTENKDVLIRAVGPGLSGFGVTNALANPRLQIYNSAGALIAENAGWNNDANVSAVGDRVGAFKLAAGSRDAAVNANLAPGAYTAVVTATSGTGVALVEVYDAATNASIASQQLVNISTRGFVDTGTGNLIAGFVVTGNAPKRVLIRGIGPSLSQFGVTGAVADPSLKVYAAGSSTVIAQNDDWSAPQSISATQTAATAADIAAASTAAGAFPLAANSKDSAIVVTLMPGQYSAVVSGANNATGAGLVEVYELSNQ